MTSRPSESQPSEQPPAQPVEALRLAVTRAGGHSAFARLIGISQQAVSRMLAKGRPLGAEYVLTAERGTGVPRTWLRPDIYPETIR